MLLSKTFERKKCWSLNTSITLWLQEGRQGEIIIQHLRDFSFKWTTPGKEVIYKKESDSCQVLKVKSLPAITSMCEIP